MTVQSAANDFPFCCKRFFNLLRTIFGRTDIRLTGFTMLKPDKGKTRMFSGFTSLLSHLPQTVFRPKRFASFRPLLYQRFKVNFLPLHPSPGFHWEMIHSIQIPIYKCKPPGNQRGYGEGLDKGFFTSYICGQKTAPKHSYYGFQKDCT